MKSLLLLIFSILCTTAAAQYFAPVGTKWHYTEFWAFSWPGEQSYVEVNATKDTVIDSQPCTEIVANKTFCGGYGSNKCWVYYSDSVVYFYDATIGSFQTMYDFTASPGDWWKIHFPTTISFEDSLLVEVDSTGYTTINSQQKKILFVTYTSLSDTNFFYSGQIIETIGDPMFLFNLNTNLVICDGNYSGGLRCYEDSTLGFYSTGIADSCAFVFIVGIEENDTAQTFMINPNPANSTLVISSNKSGTSSELKIFDMSGRLMLSMPFTGNKTEINVCELHTGAYIIEVNTDGKTCRKRFLKS